LFLIFFCHENQAHFTGAEHEFDEGRVAELENLCYSEWRFGGEKEKVGYNV